MLAIAKIAVKHFEKEQAINFFKVAAKISFFFLLQFLSVKTAVSNTENVSTQQFQKEYNFTRNYSN